MKKICYIFTVACTLCGVLATNQAAVAHLEGGNDKVVGEYLVDFGYAPASPIAGAKANLAFNLVDNQSKQMITPGYVWVRIARGEEIVFAGALYPQAQNVGLTYVFGVPARYEITARFFDKNETQLAEYVGALNVLGPPEVAETASANKKMLPPNAVRPLMHGIAGFIGGYLFLRIRRYA